MTTLKDILRNSLPRSPPILTTAQIDRLAASLKTPNIAQSTVLRAIEELARQGQLRKINSGLYMNLASTPPGAPAAAASHIRRGAMVSLLTVLADAGLTNNYTTEIWCIVPLIKGLPLSVGTVETRVATFRFHAIPENILFAPLRADLLDVSVRYPRATPEAALCHYLYLCESPRSRLSHPPKEVELDDIDQDRLHRVAKAMGIEAALKNWLAVVRDLNAEQQVSGLGW